MNSLPYSTSLRPPAPFVTVAVSGPNASQPSEAVDAQLDTGADRTVIPADVVTRLGLVPAAHLQFGVVGGVITLPVYFVTITIPGVTTVIVEAAADDDEPHILLGRDVLNALHTELDGPGRMLTQSAHPLLPPSP